MGWPSYLFLSRGHRGWGEHWGGRVTCPGSASAVCVLASVTGFSDSGQGWEGKFRTHDREGFFVGWAGTSSVLGFPCLSDNRMISKGHSRSYESGFGSPQSHPVIPRSQADRRS